MAKHERHQGIPTPQDLIAEKEVKKLVNCTHREWSELEPDFRIFLDHCRQKLENMRMPIAEPADIPVVVGAFDEIDEPSIKNECAETVMRMYDIIPDDE